MAEAWDSPATFLNEWKGGIHFSVSQPSVIALGALSSIGISGDCSVSTWACVLLLLCLDFLHAAISRRKCVTADLLIFCHFQSFCLLFYNVPWTPDERAVIQTSFGTGCHDPIGFCIESSCDFLRWSPFAVKRSLFDQGWELGESVSSSQYPYWLSSKTHQYETQIGLNQLYLCIYA